MINYLWTLAYIAIINSFILFLAVLIWHRIWVKKLGGKPLSSLALTSAVEIPIEKKIAGLEKRHLFYSTTSFSILTDFFKRQVTRLDRDYWVAHVGLDGYLYLLLQRRILLYVGLLGCFALIGSMGILVVGALSGNYPTDFFVRLQLSNNSDLTSTVGWIYVAMVVGVALGVWKLIHSLQSEAKATFLKVEKDRCIVRDCEWLRARTLHVQGLLPKDRSGEMLKNEVDTLLQPLNGRVLDVVVIPDFQNLFEIELSKRELDDLHQLNQAQKLPCATRACLKAFYGKALSGKDEYFLSEKQKYDAQIQTETEKPFLSSGHAFIVVDSVKSLNFCLKTYKLTPCNALKVARVSLQAKFESVAQAFNSKRGRSTSTFNKFVDEDMDISQGKKDEMHLVMKVASEPVDMIWRNIGGTRGIYFFRRMFFNLVGMLMVVFLSTPAVIFSTLQMMDLVQFMNLAEDGIAAKFVNTWFPPLIILCLNSWLVFVMDYTVYWEKHPTHSQYQSSFFTKAFIYLVLNMLVIPATTLTSSASVLSIMQNANFNLTEIFKDIYTEGNGIFFVSMLVQGACWSSAIGLCRHVEVGYAFFSPWLAHYKRRIVNDSESWRRRESYVFYYGYCYAQLVVMFAVVVVFAPTSPLVCFAGLMFFLFKHSADAYNLLTVHKREIDSDSGLFRSVLQSLWVAPLILEMAMGSYLYSAGQLPQAYALTVAGAFTAVVAVASYFVQLNNLYEIDSTVFNETAVEGEDHFQALQSWRKEYSHPLYIGVQVSNTVRTTTKADDEELKPRESARLNVNTQAHSGPASEQLNNSMNYGSGLEKKKATEDLLNPFSSDLDSGAVRNKSQLDLMRSSHEGHGSGLKGRISGGRKHGDSISSRGARHNKSVSDYDVQIM